MAIGRAGWGKGSGNSNRSGRENLFIGRKLKVKIIGRRNRLPIGGLIVIYRAAGARATAAGWGGDAADGVFPERPGGLLVRRLFA